METYTAIASITIDTTISKAWEALITPAIIKQYFFGTDVVSDWNEGGSIVWKGKWQGKPYEDHGVIKKIEPQHLIQYTHFSPLEGRPESAETTHTITMTIDDMGSAVTVTLSQDNNKTIEESHHSEKNWQMVLGEMKKLLEK